jgi:predicted phosphodiesterase
MQLALDTAARILVFGGPYSNVRALAALRTRAETLGIIAGHTICTGDVVAYCAEPEETVAAMRDWGCPVIAGNCEQQLAADADDCGCGFGEDSACSMAAKDWYAYARRRISAASRTWMAGLPAHLTFKFGGHQVRVVHGGVNQTNRFIFASERAMIAEELTAAAAGLVVAGHAGLPFVAQAQDRVWFNPGVIGMPANDGTADVWYGLITRDGDGVVLSTHRLAYDHAAAATATAAAGHANGYARALTTGVWPSHDVLPPTERTATRIALAEVSISMPTAPRRQPSHL